MIIEELNDGIHNCKDCEIYKKYGIPCSSSPELTIPACNLCDKRICCIKPLLILTKCEKNTILDSIDNNDEYKISPGNIPYNRKTNYCKHIDTETMKCKVYSQRPISCRISGDACLKDGWIKVLEYLKSKKERNINRKIKVEKKRIHMTKYNCDTKVVFKNGVIDGIKRYAWWKNGIQYVGSCGTTLKEAIEEVEKEFENM